MTDRGETNEKTKLHKYILSFAIVCKYIKLNSTYVIVSQRHIVLLLK